MKNIFQTFAEQAMNHYSSKAVVEALDFVAGLSEDDMKEWTALLDPDDKLRAYAVWRAARGEKPITLIPLRPASNSDPSPEKP